MSRPADPETQAAIDSWHPPANAISSDVLVSVELKSDHAPPTPEQLRGAINEAVERFGCRATAVMTRGQAKEYIEGVEKLLTQSPQSA